MLIEWLMMHPGPQRRRISREEITRRLAVMRDVTSALAGAAPADKATMYGQLGLSLVYHPEAKRVNVTARPLSGMYVRKFRAAATMGLAAKRQDSRNKD